MKSSLVLLVAGVDCAQGKEKEFNNWYNSTFPQIMMGAPEWDMRVRWEVRYKRFFITEPS